MRGDSKQGYLGQLSLVRAFAALLVVCFHTHVVLALPKYFGTSVLGVFGAGDSGVQLFFVLSGFVIYLAHRRDGEGSSAVLGHFAWKRFVRLYPALWAVLLLLLPVAAAAIFAPRPSLYEIVASFLILPLPETKGLLVVEWTLRHEILFYAMFLLFLWRRRAGLNLLLAWGIVGSALFAVIEGGWFLEFLFNSNHALFMMGMGVAWLYARGSVRRPVPALLLGLAIFAATYALKLAGTLPYDASTVLFGLGASGIIYGLVGIRRWSYKRSLSELLGGASYSLYLIHFPLVSLLTKVLMMTQRSVPLPLELGFLAIVAASQLAAIIFHLYVELPLSALFKRARAGFLERRAARAATAAT
jgi:peptidoglycan/LPS O-acetylase OafA/YrhL